MKKFFTEHHQEENAGFGELWCG